MSAFADALHKQSLLPKKFVKSAESLSARPETVVQVLTFTKRQRKALLNDGALIYLPTGETLSAQRQSRRFWYVAQGYTEDGKNRLLDFPSRPIEVAIYPDPERFFVPSTFDKTIDQQDELNAQEAESLRQRLGVGGIDIIRPEASEATEVMFRHFDETGVRLLGEDYVDKVNGYYRYIRTSTPTNKFGSHLASVGRFNAGSGPDVDGWDRDGPSVDLGAARWVVPQGTR